METVKKLTDNDRQDVQIIYLKIANLDLQRKAMISDIQRASEMIVILQTQLRAKSEELKRIYSLGPNDQIAEDGTILSMDAAK